MMPVGCPPDTRVSAPPQAAIVGTVGLYRPAAESVEALDAINQVPVERITAHFTIRDDLHSGVALHVIASLTARPSMRLKA